MSDHDQNRSGASEGFLGLLTSKQRSSLLELGSTRAYRQGQPLMHEGNTADSVIVILQGLAKVTAVSEDGKEIVLGLRDSGDLVGEMAVLSGRPRSATVIAATSLLASVIGATSFVAYLERCPQVATSVSDVMAGKLRVANRRRLEFNAYPVESRVARVLAEVTLRHGHPEWEAWRIGSEITQADLASLASVSVRTMERILSYLERDGIVQRRRRDLVVTDLAALEDRSRSSR